MRSIRFLSVLLAASALVMTLSIQGNAELDGSFPDIPPNATYAEAVEKLSEMGIITGDEKGNFNPDNTITRAESATIICRMLGVEGEAKDINRSVFSDVPSNHWAAGYIAKASELGIIGGYGNGNFGPNDPVTYEQIITMIIRAIGLDSSAIGAGGYPSGYLSVAAQIGLTEGITHDPVLPASRATVAKLLYIAVQ